MKRNKLAASMIAIFLATCLTALVYAQPAAAQQPTGEARNNSEPRLAAPPDDMFIDIQVPAHQVYLGQTMRIEYDVYVASGKGQVFYDAREPEFSKWYVFEGTAAHPSQTTVNGKSYTKEPFAVYYISAYAPGKIPLPELSVQIPYLDDKPWITHQTRIIEVIPPPEPAPAGFAPGNIGHFKLDVQTTDTSIQIGQTIDIRIQVTADAPAPQIQLVPYEIADTDAFKLYPAVRDKITEDIHLNQFRSVTSFRIRLLALHSGNYTLPPVQIVTFDPSAHQYRTIASDPMPVQVMPAIHTFTTEQSQIHTSRMDKAEPRSISLRKTPPSKPISLWFLLVAPILFAGTLGGMAVYRKRRQHHNDMERNDRIRELSQSLADAQTADSQLEALRSLLEIRYGIGRNLGSSELKSEIENRFSPEDSGELNQILTELHTLSYSTHAPLSADEIQQLTRILDNDLRGDA